MLWERIVQSFFNKPRISLCVFSLIFCGFTSATALFFAPQNEAPKSTEIPQEETLVLKTAAQLDSQVQDELFYDFEPEMALEDPESRISSDFNIPENLYERVRFWFNIYTKYDKNQHIIHHIRYPWIVYEVVDTSVFLKGKGPLWLRIQRGRDYVSQRKRVVRATLKNLSRKKNFKNLSNFERSLMDSLHGVPGKRRTVLSQAAKFVRAQLGQKDYFLEGIENSTKYLHLMEEEFANFDLPTELTRIPFVESSFNEKAQSRVGASGVWQIMPQVGKRYSIVNNNIDERNSPVKASRIAAKLFKLNYKILKSWPLAVTAYNNGIGNIQKAIRRAKSRDMNTIIERNHKGAFKFASSNFYASFLAALHAEKYHHEIFQQHSLVKAKAFHKVKYKLKRSWRPKTLVKRGALDLRTLLSYNLDLKNTIRKNALLPKGYMILLPPEKAEEFKSKFY